MLDNENVHKELKRFADYVIQQSRSNLTRKNINASKDLYNSLEREISVSENSFSFSIEANDYWKFIDAGVKGVESGKSDRGYAYRTKKPPAKVFERWAKVKPIKPRDKNTGRFITNKQFGFIMQNHIFKHGIKPTRFLTTPFQRAFKNLPDELTEAYGLDLEDFIKFTLDIK